MQKVVSILNAIDYYYLKEVTTFYPFQQSCIEIPSLDPRNRRPNRNLYPLSMSGL